MFEAKIIADSICEGNRLTTIQMTGWSALQAELNTHCSLAKNASSFRAIPLHKAIKKVEENIFEPIFWGKANRGMTSSEEIQDKEEAIYLWHEAKNAIVEIVKKMELLGLHKQVPSRLLAPFSWTITCVTGDHEGWSNFFYQRCEPSAQPEMQHVAYLVQKEYFESTPVERKLGDWHLPYVSPEERDFIDTDTLVKISTGRTARTSYLNQEGIRNIKDDIDLHNRLLFTGTPHWSPLEQVCYATPGSPKNGKFIGWASYRKMFPNEFKKDFNPNYKQYFGE